MGSDSPDFAGVGQGLRPMEGGEATSNLLPYPRPVPAKDRVSATPSRPSFKTCGLCQLPGENHRHLLSSLGYQDELECLSMRPPPAQENEPPAVRIGCVQQRVAAALRELARFRPGVVFAGPFSVDVQDTEMPARYLFIELPRQTDRDHGPILGRTRGDDAFGE